MSVPRAEKEFHRKVAARTFNEAWHYLESENRGPGDDLRMLYLAHTSRYHWGIVGTERNKAVGEWQLSRVYAELGEVDLALRFARASLSTCRRSGLFEIMPTAYEAMARVYAVAKDAKGAERYLRRARRELDRLSLDDEERRIYLGQIEDTQRIIDGR